MDDFQLTMQDGGKGHTAYTKGLDAAKKLTTQNVEYWMARDLMQLLGYGTWEKFDAVIVRASEAAKSSGLPASNHFHRTANMIEVGKGAMRERGDWYLSRYACYLIAMNADSSKPQVGHAMTYFAGKTRQMERVEKDLLEQHERVRLRLRTVANNKRLAGAAKKAGVIHYDRFHDAGYRGFYGMGAMDVKGYKGIPAKEDLLDNINSLELSAHDFRMKLAEERLTNGGIRAEGAAIHTHKVVGEEVRALMQKDNGKNPEDLPAAPSIKNIVRKHRKQLTSGKGLGPGKV
jgi:DNA-damage-inducible protein D